MRIRSLSGIKKLNNKLVLVRVDFNVPMKEAKIKETYKIEKSLPTIKYLLKHKAKVVLISHLGRPKGKEKSLSMGKIAIALEKMLGIKVDFTALDDRAIADKGRLDQVRSKLSAAKGGSVTLLENIRFLKGEEKNDPKLARAIASLGDLFVIDGFAVAHRDAASVSGIAKHLPSYAGLLMEEEIKGLSRLLGKPKKPFLMVIGGAKMETKVPLIKKLLPKVDHVLIGGGIANTCLWAKGFKIGCSLVDKNFKKEAKSYWSNKKIIMPEDYVVGLPDGKKAHVVQSDKKFKIPNSKFGIYDIGPKTISKFAKYIKKANTIVWNGAVGHFEQKPYGWGSKSIARLFASRAKGKAYGVTGGGETVEIVKNLRLGGEIDLVSTGGGAMLEFLSGKQLPGVKAVIK